MTTGDNIEAAALQEVSTEAGAFIERCASTDMATWQPHQWQHFLETVGRSYMYHLCRAVRDHEVPF
jgi:hypothetical protein